MRGVDISVLENVGGQSKFFLTDKHLLNLGSDFQFSPNHNNVCRC